MRGPSLSRWALALGVAVPMAMAGETPQRSAALAVAPWQAVVQETLKLEPAPGKGGKRLELSALGWNPLHRELVAISDRGYLAVVELGARPEPAGLAHLRSWLRLPPNVPPNAEGLAWRVTATGGEWLLATEPSPGAFLLPAGPSFDKIAVQLLPWPQGLSERLAKGGKHGVEAVAWHEQLGVLAAAQRPEPAASASTQPMHVLHAQHQQWRFPVHGEQSHLKAIEVLPDGTVLLLERTRREGAAEFQSHLRWLDLRTCGGSTPCRAPAVAFQPQQLPGSYNDEGLACTPALLCWIVNDDGAAPVPGSRLLQFQLVPSAVR